MPSEIVIIGAGVIGSAVACQLAEMGAGPVRVIDFDLEGSLSSSELNAGGVRATWNQPLNIEMAKATIEYFASVADQVGYRDCGYLWLYRPDRFEQALAARERQLAMGWAVEAWDVAEIRRRVPYIDKTDDLAGAVFGVKDGLVNPNRVKNHFRERARARGVVFEDRVLLRGAEVTASGVALRGLKFPNAISHEQKVEIFSGRNPSDLRVEEVKWNADRVVNCAGAWAAEVAKILGCSCPSFPVRRQISIFDCRDVDLTPYGMTIDPSGVYFHPEATNGLAGFANTDEPRGVNFEYDGEAFFMERIWPALYERATAFEKLKHVTGWAGLYEVSPDESGIIGEAVGGRGRIFEAHSFSGHGVIHSFAAGRALAEIMTSGRSQTIDISPLSGRRFETGALVHESFVI